MTVVDSRQSHDPARLAAAARSVLACPASAAIVVDGVEDVLAGGDELGMQDLGGVPTFSCAPDSALADAARRGRSALVTLDSGVGAPGTVDRDVTLSLGGRLASVGRDDCECCREVRDVVVLSVEFVLIARPTTGEQLPVPLDAFASDAHELNRGYLQRSVEHANGAHQEELRRAVSSLAGLRLTEIIGVALADLQPHRVEVRWVGVDGAYARVLDFPHVATSTEDLGELLRDQLHAGLC